MRQNVDRRQEIIRMLEDEGKVKVDDLSEKFDVSTVTIRSDLDFLEEKGIAHRTYGGALMHDVVSHDPHLTKKRKMNLEQKKKIGRKAAEFVHDGESIILDSGTTTRQVAVNLHDKADITVLTNAINITVELAGADDLHLLVTGGSLREQSYSLVGPDAEQVLKSYNFDKLFLGVDGFDVDTGLSTPHPQEATLNQMMIEQADDVIVVTDSSKFERKSLTNICGPEKIDRLVTDQGIPDSFEGSLKEQDIDLYKV